MKKTFVIIYGKPSNDGTHRYKAVDKNRDQYIIEVLKSSGIIRRAGRYAAELIDSEISVIAKGASGEPDRYNTGHDCRVFFHPEYMRRVFLNTEKSLLLTKQSSDKKRCKQWK